MADEKGKGACQNASFDCVVMSKGEFRKITSTEVELGKCFVVTYQNCSNP